MNLRSTTILCAWFLCILSLSAVEYPLRWRWSNPRPHGNNIVDMAYSFNLRLGVQVAERGQIYTSYDLNLWLPRASGVTNSLRAVTFFGSRTVITGEEGCVLYADSVDAFTSGVLLDGPTTDWLEAVAASQNLLVAVGDNGAIYTSSTGAAWRRQSAGTSAWMLGVAYGNGTFVITGEGGYVATSTNGTAWTKRTSGTTTDLNRVSFDGSQFTAVGNTGLILVSLNNGASWAPDSCGATNDLFHTTSAGLSHLAVGSHEVRLRENGVWSNELTKSNGPPDWSYYANIGRPNFYLIGGHTGLMAEGYKTNSNPYFWISSEQSVRNWLWDVTCQGHLYVAVGDFATVMTSANGVNWNLEYVPPVLADSIFLGVGGTSNLLVAVGDQGSIMISPNVITNVIQTNLIGTDLVVTNFTSSSFGVIWYPLPSLSTNDLQGVAFDHGLYVVTGENGVIFSSPDGTNWSRRTSGSTKLLTSVAGYPGGFVAVGDDGAWVTSANGTDWTARTAFTTNWLYRIRYLNNHLVAVGQNGVIYTRTNGASSWTSRSSGTTKWLTDAAFIEDTWFVIGYGGTVLTSTNLINWSDRGTITWKSFYALANDSRQLIAVGVEGAILRCQVLPDLTPIEILSYSQIPVTNSPAVQNIFLFGGKPDQRFTRDRTSGFETNSWVTGPLLEILDSAGTLYYYELVGTNVPAREYFRATLPSSN